MLLSKPLGHVIWMAPEHGHPQKKQTGYSSVGCAGAFRHVACFVLQRIGSGVWSIVTGDRPFPQRLFAPRWGFDRLSPNGYLAHAVSVRSTLHQRLHMQRNIPMRRKPHARQRVYMPYQLLQDKQA